MRKDTCCNRLSISAYLFSLFFIPMQAVCFQCNLRLIWVFFPCRSSFSNISKRFSGKTVVRAVVIQKVIITLWWLLTWWPLSDVNLHRDESGQSFSLFTTAKPRCCFFVLFFFARAKRPELRLNLTNLGTHKHRVPYPSGNIPFLDTEINFGF